MKFFFLFYFCIVISAYTQIIEAENGTRTGTEVSTQRSGYSGTGFVTGFDGEGDKVTMTGSVNKTGIYNLYLRYAAPSGDKYNFIFVNNQNLGSVQFPASAVFKEKLIGKVYLTKGSNTIAIVKDWGYFDLDNIKLETSEPSEINHIESGLVVPNSSDETIALYKFLCKTYGKVILSGQYGGDTELNRIKSVSGKTPLIRGFDLMEYSPSRVAHGATSTETESAIAWSAQKGIVTFAWHWNAPKDLIDQPGKEWWRGFYTDATTFDVSKAMSDPASEEHTLIIRDIDAIAMQLKKLKNAGIPVLWRPLHEAEGAWFWWGAKGPEPCKWLWKLLFDRLVNYHQLNNLIWVWTSTTSAAAMDWYPGDDCVDVIGADIYLPAGTYSTNFMMFDNLASSFGGKKLITLSENGPIPDPDRLFSERAAWNWFCTWGGDFITDGISNSASHINTVFNAEYVITLDELNSVDAIIAALELKRAELDDDEVVLGTEGDVAADYFSYQNPIRNNRLALLPTGNKPITKVAIYNVQGQLEFVSEKGSAQGPIEFDFQNKSSGVYIVRVTVAGFIKTIRVIKL
jgi:mannan endo-1,4-beta-mannosidase